MSRVVFLLGLLTGGGGGGILPPGGWIEIEAMAVQGLLTTARPKVDQVYIVWHFYDVLKLTS